MNENLIITGLKVLGANVASWTGTSLAVVRLADVGAVVAILAGLGSLALSITSVLWIRKQMARFDAEQARKGP